VGHFWRAYPGQFSRVPKRSEGSAVRVRYSALELDRCPGNSLAGTPQAQHPSSYEQCSRRALPSDQSRQPWLELPRSLQEHQRARVAQQVRLILALFNLRALAHRRFVAAMIRAWPFGVRDTPRGRGGEHLRQVILAGQALSASATACAPVRSGKPISSLSMRPYAVRRHRLRGPVGSQESRGPPRPLRVQKRVSGYPATIYTGGGHSHTDIHSGRPTSWLRFAAAVLAVAFNANGASPRITAAALIPAGSVESYARVFLKCIVMVVEIEPRVHAVLYGNGVSVIEKPDGVKRDTFKSIKLRLRESLAGVVITKP
jgi:hypothetical protein